MAYSNCEKGIMELWAHGCRFYSAQGRDGWNTPLFVPWHHLRFSAFPAPNAPAKAMSQHAEGGSGDE